MEVKEQINNVLLTELKATLARITIIKNNTSDEFMKQISKDVESYMMPLVQDVERAFKTVNDTQTKKHNTESDLF